MFTSPYSVFSHSEIEVASWAAIFHLKGRCRFCFYTRLIDHFPNQYNSEKIESALSHWAGVFFLLTVASSEHWAWRSEFLVIVSDCWVRAGGIVGDLWEGSKFLLLTGVQYVQNTFFRTSQDHWYIATSSPPRFWKSFSWKHIFCVAFGNFVPISLLYALLLLPEEPV